MRFVISSTGFTTRDAVYSAAMSASASTVSVSTSAVCAERCAPISKAPCACALISSYCPSIACAGRSASPRSTTLSSVQPTLKIGTPAM